MQYDGSLIVVPIQTPPGPTVGTINIDTLRPVSPPASSEEQQIHQQLLPSSLHPAPFSSSSRPSSPFPSSFQEHEALFYQGLGQCVGEVYHWISSRLSLLRVTLSALRWIHSRCLAVKRGEVYLVTQECTLVDGRAWTERGRGEPFLLHLMMCTCPSAPPSTNIHQQVKKQDNPFKQYLFECAETSEPFSAEAYGDHHLVHPIRDHTGCAVALVDLTISTLHTCSRHGGQLREVTKVLNLLTSAFYHLNSPPGATRRQEGDGPLEEGGLEMQRSMLENVTSGMAYRCIESRS